MIVAVGRELDLCSIHFLNDNNNEVCHA